MSTPLAPEQRIPLESTTCDRCGARAAVMAVLENLSELMFCSHHYSENKTALAKAGAAIFDRKP
jgi:hypothetical protein